jgi:MFS family permease
MFGYGMIVPVLPLFARSLGASVALASMVVGARGAGSMLFDLPAGAITSRLGRLPVLLFAAGTAAVAATATGFISSLWPLVLLTVALGATHMLWVISVQTHIRQNLSSEQRGRAMALVGGTLRVGWVVGPIAGGYLGKTYGLHTVYFGQGMLCFAALVFLLIGSDHYRFRSRALKGEALRAPGIPFLRTLRGRWSPFLLVGLVVVTLQMLRIGRQTILPLWGEHISLDVAAIGLIFGLSRAVELLLVYPAGLLMDRRGRKWAAVPCIILQAIALSLIPLSRGFTGLLLGSLLAGFGNGLGSGIVLTLGADLSPRSSTAEFLGIWHLLSDMGATTGPLLIGLVSQVFGLQAAPFLITAIGVLGAWLMIAKVPETLRKR